jgi:cytochrome P450
LVEELLRHHPVANIIRIVRHDTKLGDVLLHSGESVLLPIVLMHRTGNSEEDGVRLELAPRRHHTFGAGPHRCLGSHLARRELTVAIRAWHERIPEYGLADPSSTRGLGGSILGLDRLEVAWR